MELNDKELFAQAISDEPLTQEVQPETEAPQAQPELEAQPDAVSRDDKGRFAPKSETEPKTEVTAQPQAEPTIPPGVLREEKEKRRALERQLAEMQGQLSVLTKQQPQQQPKQPTDIFENPDEAIRERIAPQFREVQEAMLALAKDNAELRYTPEKVTDAEKAFIEAMSSRTLDPADYNRVVNSPNRYAAAVQWHQRQLVQKEVGEDLNAYHQKIRDEALKDPAFLAKAIEAVKGQANPAQQQRPNTVVRLPPSLNRASSAASPHEPSGDLSDASLYQHAIS